MTKTRETKAVIFDIERNSYVDGPGIRTTVFFKGCNLKCAWCHNPESQSMKKEILFYKNKCTGCGRCENLTVEDEKFICFNDAKEICGREYTVGEILKEVLKDKKFYENSNGGVTCSGGECMLQIDFLKELLINCKENGIHTAVDTAGNVSWSRFETILPYTDMFLYDVKSMNKSVCEKYTGADNTLILKNLASLLAAKKRVWVRMPVITSVNDNPEEIKTVKKFFDENGYPEKFEFLPYHAMGEHKYEALGRKTEKFATPEKETIEKMRRVYG